MTQRVIFIDNLRKLKPWRQLTRLWQLGDKPSDIEFKLHLSYNYSEIAASNYQFPISMCTASLKRYCGKGLTGNGPLNSSR